MGRNTGVSAAKALRLLNSDDLRPTPVRTTETRRSTAATPSTPLNLGLVDYVTEHFDEVVTHTRDIAGPIPRPRADEDLYEWYVDHTADADANQAAYRALLIERHALEHAITLGDHDEVSKHPCPSCGLWGLMWNSVGNRAQCSNRKCRTPDGMTSSWTLARLAEQKIQRTEIWRRNAT
jgi:hypothetical protein